MSTTTLRSLCALAVASVAWQTTLSHAAILSGDVIGGTSGGVFELLGSPPTEAGPDTFQSPNLIGFDEQQRVVLTDPLPVSPERVLPAGSIIFSHYVVFDPNQGSSVIGHVDFDHRIVAILGTPAALNATAPLLGSDTTTYSVSPAIGPEDGGIDSVLPAPGMPTRLLFTGGAGSPGDHVRVLTGIIPEPSTMALCLLAGGGLAIAGFRRHR